MRQTFLAAGIALSLLLSTGCTPDVEDRISAWAINSERERAHLEHRQLTVDGFNIAYLEGGQGDTVFLIHGFQSNKDIWVRMARELTSRYHVVAIDLPAHGESTILPDRSYTVPEQAKRVIAIMDALGLKQPVNVMGHSMGGAIAFHVAVMAPDHVKSLALVSSAGVISPTPSELWRQNQQGKNPLIVRNEQDYKAMLDFTLSDRPWIPGAVIATLTREAISRQQIGEKIYRELAPANSMKAEEALPKIHVPALVVWGDQDKVLDVSSVGVFKQYLPQAKVTVFKGVGHAPPLERSEETARLYEDFLKQG